MNAADSPDGLLATVSAARELMIKRLEGASLDSRARREMQRALEELDAMREELHGQAMLLTRENQRYAEFFDNAPDALVITDAGGRVREVNETALELLGATRDDLVSRPLAECVPGRNAMQSRPITLKENGGRGLCWLIRPQIGPDATPPRATA